MVVEQREGGSSPSGIYPLTMGIAIMKVIERNTLVVITLTTILETIDFTFHFIKLDGGDDDGGSVSSLFYLFPLFDRVTDRGGAFKQCKQGSDYLPMKVFSVAKGAVQY
jgi:hypothetical protein